MAVVSGVVWMETFHFLTFVYCFTYYFPESLYSCCSLKGSSRFWNKNMLLVVSADLINQADLLGIESYEGLG